MASIKFINTKIGAAPFATPDRGEKHDPFLSGSWNPALTCHPGLAFLNGWVPRVGRSRENTSPIRQLDLIHQACGTTGCSQGFTGRRARLGNVGGPSRGQGSSEADRQGSEMAEEWRQWEGQVVDGEFHLRQYLGGSGQNAVFLAEHGERKAQRVAIKFVPANPKNSELQLSRWQVAAKLSHLHLLRIFQTGRCQLGNRALLYVVMEYAEENLSQILPQRPLTPAESREMLRPLLDVLAYIHGKGLVHAHIKPANILAVNDQLRLSSDGLLGSGESSGGLGGASAYDPPEAPGADASTAGDVWSLGMTLVEALTQRLPVWKMTEEDPVLPATVPEPFFGIARNCLRQDPQKRWTVADIAVRMQRMQPRAPAPQAAMHQPATTNGTRVAFAKWGYLVPLGAAGLALLALVAGPRLLNRDREAQPAASVESQAPVASQPPSVDPKPKPSPVSPKAESSTRRSSDSGQSSRGATASQTALRPVATATLPTGNLVHGEVLQQITPDVSQRSRDTIQGTVRVRVRVAVDPSGKVVGTTFDSPGPSKYFANLALQAGQHWQFSPAEVAGRPVSSEWVLRFEFARTSTKVIPTPVVP
jgi:TonB family protein